MVLAHLKKAGYTKKLDIWVPHKLTERNLMNRVLVCDSLLRRNETEPFLKKLITGDEKWITYNKKVRKRSWTKAGQASQTVAKHGAIDSELYCEQLMRLNQKVERKRPELINRRGVVFHHDNARPHTSLATQQKLREFGWEGCVGLLVDRIPSVASERSTGLWRPSNYPLNLTCAPLLCVLWDATGTPRRLAISLTALLRAGTLFTNGGRGKSAGIFPEVV
ncbi:hypothetical protein K1T71_004339 [Dendrolimus kikuchii]|uniref:Uncharacterized protein n=1 Tax=Dendrolimus kikuchii TaxID=765133 RepID=A0ACC1D764_9NEOP|nr:hypothetical protein K1T71_004339 [Dendrolimus kikuchii]